MSKIAVLFGSLDTKGKDYAFVKERIEEKGFQAFVIDVGVMGEPLLNPISMLILSQKQAEKAWSL